MPLEVRQYKDQLEGRTMLVKRAKVIPLEAIVRGYLTGQFGLHFGAIEMLMNPYLVLLCSGSGWSEYKKAGTVHGIALPTGLVESEKLPEPLFTPSTKAEQGQHDENISPEKGMFAYPNQSVFNEITTRTVQRLL